MIQNIKRASFKHKNNKLAYYTKNYLRQITPAYFFKKKLNPILSSLNEKEKEHILQRVNYYNKLNEPKELCETAVSLADFKLKNHQKTYFFDTYEYTRYFPSSYKICPLFGDVTFIPDHPSLTKTRPIAGNNENSILLKLNKPRHYIFVNDKNLFTDKKDMLVSRSKARQEHRIRFLEQYSTHPMCNVGQVNTDMNNHFLKNRLTIEEQLKYKFILCLEGNDVASNLKWVMSSNSIAVMPKPKHESWFMEGTLIPDYHYILIKDDFSDLEERLTYYINHTSEALKIIENAHNHISEFKNEEQEKIISLLVLDKYFEKTNQKTQ
ncbi:lipopolysaccharide biosynthesis protein [Paludibacteraceae bacterium OttesenSCG-928-F17]|nr:lipopolysaccharide biosynthesis protein [Paludibacteraceae bacterium OttesenSCG-928-F17]